jgi:transposase
MLGLSIRQTRNKLRRYEKEGPDGLIHKNKGRASPLKWGGKEKELFLELCNGDFKGFGPTLLSEKLRELHGIEKSKETLRKVMIEEGITKNKTRKPHHRMRSWTVRCMIGLRGVGKNARFLLLLMMPRAKCGACL